MPHDILKQALKQASEEMGFYVSGIGDTKMARERGLISCAEMVRAFLECRKSQTRRIEGLKVLNSEPNRWKLWRTYYNPLEYVFEDLKSPNQNKIKFVKPRLQVGDHVYIKETYGWAWNGHGHECLCYKADDGPTEPQIMRLWDTEQKKWVLEETEESAWPPDKWISSRFMPKLVARLWYRVAAVIDPQQIQAISEEDAIAEGMLAEGTELSNHKHADNPIEQFAQLWNRLHPHPGERWQDNPWHFPYVLERIPK